MDPFVGEIRLISFNFAPAGWAFCNGQILNMTAYPALYSLIGVLYGGDGKTTFALPDLRGRTPMVASHVNGSAQVGVIGGTATNTLTLSQLPLHSHSFGASTFPGSSGAGSPQGNIFGDTGMLDPDYATYPQEPINPPLVNMSSKVIADAGAAQPFNNMMPYLGINFIIALQGIYPPRP